MRRREAADAEQRHRDRNLRLLGERQQRRFRAAENDAVPGQNQRTLRGVDERDRIDAASNGRDAPATRDRAPRLPSRTRRRRVWASFVMSTSTGPGRPLAAIANASRIAGATSSARVTRKLCLVIGSVMPVMSVSWNASDPMSGAADLPGDADDRRRIHHRRGDAGHHVGRAGPGGRDRDADLAGRARVAVGHVRGALLVADEDVPDRIVEHRVVRRQDRPAGIAEDDVDAFAHQAFPENLRTSQSLLTHASLNSDTDNPPQRPQSSQSQNWLCVLGELCG